MLIAQSSEANGTWVLVWYVAVRHLRRLPLCNVQGLIQPLVPYLVSPTLWRKKTRSPCSLGKRGRLYLLFFQFLGSLCIFVLSFSDLNEIWRFLLCSKLLIEPRSNLLPPHSLPLPITFRTRLHILWGICTCASTVITDYPLRHKHFDVLSVIDIF